jgi:hypothetical protein
MAQTEALTVPTLWKVIQKVYLSYVEVGKVSPKLLSLVENLKFYQDLRKSLYWEIQWICTGTAKMDG